MADAYWTFGFLLALGIAFPGFLYSCWLLFPKQVERSRQQLEKSPRNVFGVGMVLTIGMAIPLLILVQIPLPFAQLSAVAFTVFMLGYAGIGGAAITVQMAKRLIQHSQQTMPLSTAFLRSAVAYELAVALPIIGWFLFLPISVMTALGANFLSWRGRKGVVAQMPANSSDTTPSIIIQP